MKIEWEHFNCPNMEDRAEIQTILEQLVEEQDDENEFLTILYNDLLPKIKHQYRIYDVVIPTMDWFEKLLIKHPDFPRSIDILDFLGHVFSEYIRELTGILTTPSTYDYASKNLIDFDPVENSYFIYFKKFYLSLFSQSLPKKETRSLILYDLCFTEDFLEKYSTALIKIHDPIVLFDISIAIGAYKYLHPQYKNFPVDFKINEKTKNKDLILAINGQKFDDTKLKSIIRKNDTIESIWGHGFLTVTGADSLLIYGQNDSTDKLFETIDFICETYNIISKHETDNEFDFPCHKFLMEDASSILFKDYMGTQKKLKINELTPPQKYFFEKLSKKLKIHTNSMLRAGLLPAGANKKDLLKINDIHEYYNS